jgi:outer membrane protein, heavy metal efflux system
MKTVPILFGLSVLAGCAHLPLEQQQSQVQSLVQARHPVDAVADPVQPADAVLTRDAAIAQALSQSPRAHALQAKLGLARADALAAMRLSNPGFTFARMTSADGDKRISRSIGLDLADALLLPVRRRYASDELAKQRLLIAEQLIDLAYDAESLWWRATAALQVQRMRAAAGDAANASAQLAERYYQAGNISQMQWQRERAVAAEALIAAARTEVEALRLQGRLAALLGLNNGAELILPTQLDLPPESDLDREALLSLAEENALQLAAARADVALAERGLRWQRRWRWLGGAELEYEREHEGAAAVLRGPRLTLSLPIFHQNQAEVAHAQSALALAQAQLDEGLLEGAAAIDSSLVHMRQQQRIIGTYRDVLLQARELIVGEQQLRYNFMLIGAFELIEARRAQYDAYEAYIEAIRDGWLARIELKRAVGSDPFAAEKTDGQAFDADAVFKPAAPPDHSGLDHSKMNHAAPAAEPDAVSEHATDHSGMDHSKMDHSKMNHAAPAAKPDAESEHATDHSQHQNGEVP